METLLMILTVLAFLAFVVGMINPNIVLFGKLSRKRGTVALLYLGIFFVTSIVAAQLYPNSAEPSQTDSTVTPFTDSTPLDNPDRSTEQHNQDASAAQSTEQNTTEEETGIGKSVEVGHFIYTVNGVQFRKTIGDEYFGETADGIFLLVNLTIQNISDQTRTLDNSCFSLTDKDGVKFEYSTTGEMALIGTGQKTLFLKDVQPKINTKGVLVFEVPERTEYYLHLAGNFWGTKSAKVLLK